MVGRRGLMVSCIVCSRKVLRHGCTGSLLCAKEILDLEAAHTFRCGEIKYIFLFLECVVWIFFSSLYASLLKNSVLTD